MASTTIIRRQRTLPARLRSSKTNSSAGGGGGDEEAEEYISLRDILSRGGAGKTGDGQGNVFYGRGEAWRIWRESGRGSMNMRQRKGSMARVEETTEEEEDNLLNLGAAPPNLLLKNRLLHRAALAYCLALPCSSSGACSSSSVSSWTDSLSAAFLRPLRRLASHCCLALAHLHRNYIRPFLLSHIPSTTLF